MATEDIKKVAIYDARIEQTPAQFAVNKGGLAVTATQYKAIAASASQVSFTINVPSQNVFLDRAPDFQATVNLTGSMTVTPAAPIAAGTSLEILRLGKNAALCAFPLTSIFATLQVTINDASTTQNLDVADVLFRMTDQRKNNIRRHCPNMLDTFAKYKDAVGFINSPLNGYGDATSYEQQPNGAWYNVKFTGAALAAGVGGAIAFDDNSITYTAPAGGQAGAFTFNYTFQFSSSEKLFISPFIFADEEEYSTVGLFGLNNANLVFNTKNDMSRILRIAPAASGDGLSALTAGGFTTLVPETAFQDASIVCQYITPSLDLPLPAKSIVPYLESPRYIQSVQLTENGLNTVQSNNVVLPSVPDLIAIYLKKKNYAIGDAEYTVPIRKINMLWDNVQGLLSSFTPEQLFQMSVENGLRMDWNTWSGRARAKAGAVPTCGGMLLIKPGENTSLASGIAPSVIGNYVMQYDLTVDKSALPQAETEFVLYTVCFFSGYFESMSGSSRIRKGILSEADVLAAEPLYHKMELKRMVGHGWFSKLGSMLSKAVDIYSKTKPAISAVKGLLPEGKVKDVLQKVGYGHVAGGAVTGGAAARRSLSDRLI